MMSRGLLYNTVPEYAARVNHYSVLNPEHFDRLLYAYGNIGEVFSQEIFENAFPDTFQMPS